jgi:hypothetical protein
VPAWPVIGLTLGDFERMKIDWTKADRHYEYYYGKTDSRFTAQVGLSTNAGKYVWTIFHEDFRYCVYGGESGSVADAQRMAVEWLENNLSMSAMNVA